MNGLQIEAINARKNLCRRITAFRPTCKKIENKGSEKHSENSPKMLTCNFTHPAECQEESEKSK